MKQYSIMLVGEYLYKSGMEHVMKVKGGEDNRHSEIISLPASIFDPDIEPLSDVKILVRLETRERDEFETE